MVESEAFAGWCIVELMGHRKVGGYVSEETIAGAAFLRIDVYDGEDETPAASQYYRPESVYCITPTTADLARKMGRAFVRPPVTRYELPVIPEPAATVRDCRHFDENGDPC